METCGAVGQFGQMQITGVTLFGFINYICSTQQVVRCDLVRFKQNREKYVEEFDSCMNYTDST